MAMVRGTNANKGSQVPSGGSFDHGNSGKTKNVTGKGIANVMPSVRPAASNKRGGPAKTPKTRSMPTGKHGGAISSGGGSFGQ